MKSLIIVLTLAAAYCHAELADPIIHDYVHNIAVRSGTGEKLKSFLEKLKDTLKTGDPTTGIPKLDPLQLEHQDIDIQDDQITIKGTVDDVLVQGLSEYTIQFVDLKLGKWNMTIDLLWNEVRAKTKYDIDGEAMNNVPFYGKGELDAEVKNFNFVSKMQLKVDLKNKKAKILEVTETTISLEKLKLDVTGLLDNDDLSGMVSKVVSDMAPKFVKDFQEEITTKVNKLILEKGNELLEKFDMSGIIGGIVG